MHQNRRAFLLHLLAVSIVQPAAAQDARTSSPMSRQPVPDTPDAGTFRSGDFVWPKGKGAVVPRNLQSQPSDDQKAWDAAREEMLRADPATSGISPEVAGKLRSMSYKEFEALYFATPDEPADENARSRRFSPPRPTLYVGHVGIIEITAAGVPFVIEATIHDGMKGAVVRTSYEDWLKIYAGKQVWHGRVRDLNAAAGARIAEEANRQVGKPYGFFNFDLNDDTSFYCSKLAWMSVWRATSTGGGQAPIAVDGDPNPRRPFFGWFSPKQLVNARHVVLLHEPGAY